VKKNFEKNSDRSSDRIAMLETRAAELERMFASLGPEAVPGEYADPYAGEPAEPDNPDFGDPDDPDLGDSGGGLEDEEEDPGPDDRTEILISRGRVNAVPRRTRFLRAHWKVLSGAAVVIALVITLVLVTGGSAPASWPSSVARMQPEITAACKNPNVAAEPSQVNFACGAGTRQVLWVFALLTSGGNPGYVDASTGRKGLEPITPAQGGDVAWSLNLHAPYNASSPADSLEVAARAFNNIIAGATLTNSSGSPSVENGLESSAANCKRYTGSGDLRTQAGYPPLCAHALTASGEQALVTDVFNQWMGGEPAQLGTDAGVLFANANDPGNPQVQKILASLPGLAQ
jgi:hypothetical protein